MSSHLTPKKCPLCSRLSSKFRNFFRRLFGFNVDCQEINIRTINDSVRVEAINAAASDCVCEKFRMSTHSPGVVEDSERFARFVFSPIQVDKKGKVKPNSFSHVHSRGCSIQRESHANDDEILALVNLVLNGKDDRAWKGVIFGKCQDMRSIVTDAANLRAVCAYDTANPENPAHAELCQTQNVINEADAVELRHNLFTAFGSGTIIEPHQYRNGAVWNSLSLPLQAR